MRENTLKGDRLNLEQALAASCHHLACRGVGDRRMIVERRQELLAIHIQRRSRKRWIIDDDGGSVRYLTGLLRDALGRYLFVATADDLSILDEIRGLLPLSHQTLLIPASDDWCTIERDAL